MQLIHPNAVLNEPKLEEPGKKIRTMPLQHFLAHILNQLLAGPVTAMMNWIGHPPLNPAAPINGVFTMELIAFLMLLIFFILVRLTLSVEKPSVPQRLAEMVEEFVTNQTEPIIGHKYKVYLPFLAALVHVCAGQQSAGSGAGCRNAHGQPCGAAGTGIGDLRLLSLAGIERKQGKVRQAICWARVVACAADDFD